MRDCSTFIVSNRGSIYHFLVICRKPAAKSKGKSASGVSANNIRTWQWSELTDGEDGAAATERIMTLTFREYPLRLLTSHFGSIALLY